MWPIPNPFDLFGVAVGGAVGWAWDKVIQGVYTWFASGLLMLMEWVWSVLDSATTPRLTESWFASGLVAGLSLVPVVLGISRQWARESRVALAFSVPSVLFFVFFWPPQGIALEMDMVVAAFPAIYPLLWVSSQSVRASLASAGLLALGHWTFWRVVTDEQFINDMLR